jgi:hypothetical protein
MIGTRDPDKELARNGMSVVPSRDIAIVRRGGKTWVYGQTHDLSLVSQACTAEGSR